MDTVVTDQSLNALGPAANLPKGQTLSVRSLLSLPHGAGMPPAFDWKTKFMPTLLAVFFVQANIWTIDGDALCPTLQLIWDAVYPGKPTVVISDTTKIEGAVFYQVSQ